MFKQSTKDMWRLTNGTGWRHPILFIHAWWYLANTTSYVNALLPIFRFTAKHLPPSFARFALSIMVPVYHGKVVNVSDAKKFVTIEKDIRVDDKTCEKVIPFERARQIIINNPDSLVTIECGCRHYRKKHEGTCCSSEKYGMHMCIGVGEPLTQFTLDHSQLNPLKLTVEEALDYLDEFHKLGFVHTIYYKDALNYSAYAMCNCCKCCCGAMQINNKIMPAIGYSQKMIVPSGYVAKTDLGKCKGCGTCVKMCPFEARKINPSTKKSEVMYDQCYGCSVCVDQCPNGAISLQLDPKKGGIPLDFKELQKHNLLNA